MKHIFVLLALAFVLPSCNALERKSGNMVWDIPLKKGNGIAATQTRTVPTFTKIVVEGSIDVIAHAGKEQKVEVRADSNLIQYIKTEVRDGALHIYSDNISYSTDINISVNIDVAALEGVTIEGSGDAVLNNVTATNFTIEIAGSGDVAFNGTATDISVQVAGSGNVVANGKAENVNIEIDGSGDVKMQSLPCSYCSISINGSGNVYTNVSKELKADVNGSGDIEYSGNPQKVTPNINGSGELIKR